MWRTKYIKSPRGMGSVGLAIGSTTKLTKDNPGPCGCCGKKWRVTKEQDIKASCLCASRPRCIMCARCHGDCRCRS